MHAALVTDALATEKLCEWEERNNKNQKWKWQMKQVSPHGHSHTSPALDQFANKYRYVWLNKSGDLVKKFRPAVSFLSHFYLNFELKFYYTRRPLASPPNATINKPNHIFFSFASTLRSHSEPKRNNELSRWLCALVFEYRIVFYLFP